jgi:hypothetical protein
MHAADAGFCKRSGYLWSDATLQTRFVIVFKQILCSLVAKPRHLG